MPSLDAATIDQVFDLISQRWTRLTERDLRSIRRNPSALFEIMWTRYGYLNDRVAREVDEMAQRFRLTGARAS